MSAPIYLQWIGYLVIAQVCAITFLGLLTLILLKFRTWKVACIAILKDAYGQSIADVVCGEDETLFVPQVTRFQFVRRQALKEALLDNIGSITGPERDVLVDAYISLGLSAMDVRHCRSQLWSRRLEALMSLSQLGRPEFIGLFNQMRHDTHPLISSCAILGLSYFENGEEPETTLDSLPAAFFQNHSLLFALTSNLVNRFGQERFEDYVRDRASTQVGQAIIAVLTNVQTPEASIFLVEILTTNLFPDARLALRVERAIRQVGDPVAIAQLDYFQATRGEISLKGAV